MARFPTNSLLAALLPLLAALLLLSGGVGCNEPEGDDDTTGDDDDTTGDDDDATGDDDDTGEPLIPPCSGESWGSISDPAASIHVRADGSDDGDGSGDAPLLTIQAALELSRASGDKRIAVGPGEFETHVVIREDAGDENTDNGLVIEGCGADETILTGSGNEDENSILLVSEAKDVRLAGFAIQDGRRPLWIWNGATTEVELVEILDNARVGVIIGGLETVVSLTDVQVRDTVTDDGIAGNFGYGIAVQSATVDMVGVDVSNSKAIGVLVDWGMVSMSDVTVDGTQPNADGHLGRGVQAQNYAMLTMDSCEIGLADANHDAGVFAQGALWVDLANVAVDGTQAGNLVGDSCEGDDCPGEGIVVTQGDLGEDPANFEAFLTDNTVTGSVRAGILIDSVSTELSGNVAAGDNGYAQDDYSIFAQGDLVDGDGNPVLTGDQDPPPMELAEPRPLYLELVVTDDYL